MGRRLQPGEFFGRKSRSWESCGFRLTESVYAPGLRLPHHSHELAKFCFVISGDYVETLGGRAFNRRPLSLIFHPPDTTHSEAHNAAGSHFLVEVDARWLSYAREHHASLDCPVEFSEGVPIRAVTQLYNEFRHLDTVSPLAVQGLAFELLAETSRRSAGERFLCAPLWLEQVTAQLRERFQENLSLEELAQSADVHAVHLARVFRKHNHCTVGEYVRRLRVEYASRRLSTSDAPLAEIAAAAGFADQSHFSRLFKRQTGISPSQFRAAFRTR
jgi:AraC family transcriptional regulator